MISKYYPLCTLNSLLRTSLGAKAFQSFLLLLFGDRPVTIIFMYQSLFLLKPFQHLYSSTIVFYVLLPFLILWEIGTLTNTLVICCENFLPSGGNKALSTPSTEVPMTLQTKSSPWRTNKFIEFIYWTWLRRYRSLDTVMVWIKVAWFGISVCILWMCFIAIG